MLGRGTIAKDLSPFIAAHDEIAVPDEVRLGSTSQQNRRHIMSLGRRRQDGATPGGLAKAAVPDRRIDRHLRASQRHGRQLPGSTPAASKPFIAIALIDEVPPNACR